MSTLLYAIALYFSMSSPYTRTYFMPAETKVSEDILPYIELGDEEFSEYLEMKQKNGENIIKFLQNNGAVCDRKYHRNCELYFTYAGAGDSYKGYHVTRVNSFFKKEISIKNEGLLRNRSVKVTTTLYEPNPDKMAIMIPFNGLIVRSIYGSYNRRTISIAEATQAMQKFLIENNYKIIEK